MLYREALNLAYQETMAADEAVVTLGEDVGFYGGSYRVTEHLYEKFGAQRVIDTQFLSRVSLVMPLAWQ